MVLFSFIAVISIAAGVFASPGLQVSPEVERSLSPKSEQANYYYSFWSEKGSFNCNNGPGGQYSINWNNKGGGFVCGKGWSTGGSRLVPSLDFPPLSYVVGG
jgi:endo-1,4-beta-xylanase